MTHEYKPHGRYEASIDTSRCRASVHDSGRGVGFHQCGRRPAKDKRLCRQHSPEAQAERDKKRGDKYQFDLEHAKQHRIRWGLKDATVEQLREELASRD